MKSLCIAIALVCSAGCEPQAMESGVDTSVYDLYDADSGVKVQVNSTDVPSVEYFVNAWFDIQVCSGLSAYSAPFVSTVDTVEGLSGGLYYFGDRVIILEYYYGSYSLLIQHEYLHYLLDVNGISLDHSSYLFDVCVPGTVGD